MSRGGDEHNLRHGDYSAVVTEVGAGLRVLRFGERDLVMPYGRDEVRPRYRGAVLAPWVNRVVDGRYELDGAAYQLDINEPERHHALHGLVCWTRWTLLDRRDDAVTLAHRLVPRPGYPFEVEVTAAYRLADDGLTCTVTGRNLASRRAPYGAAAHPYLLGASGSLDTWTLTLPAEQVLDVTPDRLVPTQLHEVGRTGYDFRTGRLLAGVTVDHAFTGLMPGDDGLVRASVSDERGRGVQCVWDPEALPWVQVHTADLPDSAASRLGLALEPMPSPPDAFNSGVDLVVLEPGAEHTASWRIAAL